MGWSIKGPPDRVKCDFSHVVLTRQSAPSGLVNIKSCQHRRHDSLENVRVVSEQTSAKLKAECPNCGPERTAHVLAEHDVERVLDEDHGIWQKVTSRILQCAGCEIVYYQEVGTFSEDYENEFDANGEYVVRYNETIKYFPALSKRPEPNWFSPFEFEGGLYGLLKETYNALNADARVLAAVGARTIFDRAAELLKVDPALSFAEKLERLEQLGHIGRNERTHLDILTDAGGAAAHRGWRPTPDQLDTVMSIVESFIHRAFILDPNARLLKKQIPKRQRRRK